MKQRFTLIILHLLLSCVAFAGPVDLEQAKGKAAKFMKMLGNDAPLVIDAPAYAPARTIRGIQTSNPTPAFYVFNAEHGAGYVIISGEDKTDEVLGYATSGNFDMDNMPSNVQAWLQGYAEQIALMDQYTPQPNKTQSSTQWAPIAPLVKTQWDQGSPYNAQCPLYGEQRSVTGCTATAMAQVMKYHEWPQEATAQIPAYQSSTTGLMPKLSATTFKWSEMKNTYKSSDKADAVAELMLYCGQALKSEYTSMATGAFSSDVAEALTKYFNYDKNIEQKNISFYTISEWEEMIYNELKEKRPVFHAGYSMGGGHAFVCDGYDGNGMFHFNWGWSGSYDGYFKLALLVPEGGGIGSGSAEGYSAHQEITIGIQPPTGKAAITRYFVPHDEQIIDNTMFSFFSNPHYASNSNYVGFGIIDENNQFVKLVKSGGEMTLKPKYQESKYIGVNIATDNIKLDEGTHRIATVCRTRTSTRWKRVGSAQKYFEVKVNSLGNVTEIIQHPIIQVALTDMRNVGNQVQGVNQTLVINLENQGDEYQGFLYLFASPTDDMGEALSRAPIFLKRNESTEIYLNYTPETDGTYTLWVTKDQAGKNVLTKTTIDIKKAPTTAANLSLISCSINKSEIDATVRIRNAGTQPYYREIIGMILENLYDDGYLYATQSAVLPGDIEARNTKTFNFDFDAESYNQCAIGIFYYKKHTDTNYVQLGNYQHFVSEETPVESIEGTIIQPVGDIYRLDGTKVDLSQIKGIVIQNGKKVLK